MMMKLLIWSFLVALPGGQETRAFCQSSLSQLKIGVEDFNHSKLTLEIENSFSRTSVSPPSLHIDLDSYISDMSQILALLSKNEAELFFEDLQKESSVFLERNFGRHFIDWLKHLKEPQRKRLKNILTSERPKTRNSKASQIRMILDDHLPLGQKDQKKLFRKLLNEYSLLRGTSRHIDEVIDSNGRILIEALRKRKLIHWNRIEGEPIWIEDSVALESLQNAQLPILFAITPNSRTKKMDLFVAIDPESRDFEKDQLNSSLESQINLYTVHSHVARGQDVIFSGIIWVNLRGESTYASLESGHYMLPRIKRIHEFVNSQLSIPKAQTVLETLAERDRQKLSQLLIDDFKIHFLAFDHLKERFFVRQNEWLNLFPRYSDR